MSGSGTQNRPILSMKVRLLDGDIRRLYEALARVIERDPNVRAVPGCQQVSLLGTDETQLEQVIARIRHESGLILEVGEPKVIYLKTICRTAEAESKYIRQIGGRGNYAHVKLRVEPVDAERGIEFFGTAKTIPDRYIPAAEQGVREAATRGVQGGHEIVGVRAVLYDGSYHEIDSNEMAFRIAGETAFNEAVAKAGRILLEPMMAIKIAVPEEYAEIVRRELLSRRRGRNVGLECRENSYVIHAIVPLAEMLGYSSPELTMHFIRYVEVPSPEDYEGETGVIARTPRGPRPKHGFTTLPEPE